VLLIKTLGGLVVYDGARALTGAAQQPRRQAILALLARAGDRGVSRDQLLAILWPDADEERARRGLNQALYALRQDLGSEDAITGNRDLRLDPALVDSDVRLFGEERAAGRFEAAAELWGGPFLRGFNLPGVPEFERWVDTERAALTHDYADLLETLANRATERKDPGGAVPWWRRLAALDPLNARTAEGLMRAQAAAGDEAGALRQAEIFAAFYAAELGVAPDPRINALAERIRRGELRPAVPVAPAAAPAAPPVMAEPQTPPAQSVQSRVTPPEAPPAVSDAGAITVTSGWAAVALPAGASRRPAPSGTPLASQARSRKVAWMVAAVAAIAAIALAARLRPPPRAARNANALPVLAVGRIVDYTKASTGDRAAPLGDMLATNLARVPGLEVVSTSRMLELVAQLAREGDTSSSAVSRAARAAGASEVIDGALYEVAPGRFRLDLRRVDLATGNVRDAHAIAGVDLFALADSGTRELAALAGGTAPEGSLSAVSTRSEAAYAAYASGLRAFYRGDMPGARQLFGTAVREDSSFAMAQFYLARTETDLARLLDAMERARRLSTMAPPREGLTIRSAWAFYQDDPSFRAVAETLSVNYPAEVAGHLWYGQALTRSQQFSAAIPMFQRVIAMDSLGLKGSRAECLACEAYQALIYNYIALDSLPAAERTVRRWMAGQPESPAPYTVLADLLQLQGRTHDANKALGQAESRGLDGPTAYLTASVIAMRAEDYRRSDSILEAHVNVGSVNDRFEAGFQLATSRRAQGRFDAALEALARSREAYAGTPSERLNERGSLLQGGQALFESGRTKEAIRAFDSTTRLVDPRETPATRDRVRMWALVLRASVYGSLADTLMLRRLADSAELLASESPMQRGRALPAYVRALQLDATGKHNEAAALLRSVPHSPITGLQTFDLLLARALVSAGRPKEAVPVLQVLFHGYRGGGGLYTTQTELHEAMALTWDAAGNADSARAHWTHVAEGWKNADPVLAPRLARAKAGAARRQSRLN
jgi:DNA-binding SARP family transcriptional activator/tetratricopeptide (TPR) repeat protein